MPQIFIVFFPNFSKFFFDHVKDDLQAKFLRTNLRVILMKDLDQE
jgi:hypothetical protein